jgi:hypothetical protein
VTPQRKATDRRILERLAAAGTAAHEAEAAARARATERDDLLLQARRTITPTPSLRDLAELGRVSYTWIRKLERRDAQVSEQPPG